jgi:hypothetical protein
MNSIKKTTILILFFTCVCVGAYAQWPKEIQTKNGTAINVYQPQPESMKGNKVDGRAAFSAQEKTSTDPLFGVFWFTATMTTTRSATSKNCSRRKFQC